MVSMAVSLYLCSNGKRNFVLPILFPKSSLAADLYLTAAGPVLPIAD